jgi:hypothetical protein
MRGVVLVVVIAACGANDTGKAEVTCGASWDKTPPVAGTCDSACIDTMTGSGASCTTTIVYGPGGGNYVCASTFDFEGVRGCCLDIGMLGQISGGSEPERQRRVFFLTCGT